MDFSNSTFDRRRSVWSYAKVQDLTSFAIRNKSAFFKPFPKGEFLIDIGPGPNMSDKFYNIDYTWSPGVDRCLDITKGMGLPQSRVAGAFTEHCLEHIDIGSCVGVLREVRASLIDGAWLRIIVPDLAVYVRQYQRSHDTGQNVMPYNFVNLAGFDTPAVHFNVVMREHGHRFIYDMTTMRSLLEQTGYRNITQCAYLQGNDKRLLRDTEHRQIESLYVEAQK